MSSDRRDLISDLYHRALARAPEERAAFLLEACNGDEALREEVASLLEFEPASARFLEAPAAGVSVAPTGTISMIDRQLGPYTITAPLGAGGMGEVYRARDSKLGRDVAIKILPSHFTADPERRSRFAREARLLATLNHPHIGAIYGLEEGDGVSALVLELVEGTTLAERLQRGALPLAGALAIARQITEALEAAHEKGIVHRDLKPANIVLQGAFDRLSNDVQVKVLDFGLAKPMALDVAAGPTQAPSDSFDGTADGRILGTPAYMSPEQARGLPIDKRSDIWAFGCVLFEMLSGRRPFEGKTITDTLAQVLEREPDWAALPSATPDTVRKLLRRCVVKDSSHRLRDIRDVRLELEDAATARESTPFAVQAPPSRLRLRPVLLTTLGVLILSTVLWLSLWSDLPLKPATVAQAGPVRLTFDEGLQTDPTLSPDGRFLAYSSNNEKNFDIYTQPVAGGKAVPVTNHPAHDWQPDWSVKDQIVFRSERDGGGLYVVAAPTGGHEQRVASFGHVPQWSPDGTRILFRRWPSAEIYVVSPDREPQRVCVPCSDTAFGWRDDQHFSLLSTGPGPQFEPRLQVLDLVSGAPTDWIASPAVLTSFRESGVLVETGGPVVWAPHARAVYFIGRSRGVASVWKLDVDPDTHSVTGGPHRVTPALADDTTGIAVARTTGSMAFSVSTRIPQVRTFPLDSSGRRIAGAPGVLTSSATESNYPDMTPDGKRIVFTVRRPGGLQGSELKLRTLSEPGDRTLLVSDTVRGEARTTPHISADSRHVVFRYVPPESLRAGRSGGPRGVQQLRVLDLETNEESELTRMTVGVVLPNGWSRDGRSVVVTLDRRRLPEEAKGMAIGLLPVAAAPNAESQIQIITTSVGDLWQPSMSPDGRWLAFRVGSNTDPRQIAVVGSKDGQWTEPQDERSWRYLESDGAAARDKPCWSVDGRMLYYVSAQSPAHRRDLRD